MATPPPPPGVVIQKKRGLGCFGCGCLTALALLFLLLALVGGGGYYTYATIRAYTSPTAIPIPSLDAGLDVYHATKQKIAAFSQSVQQHQAATLHLNSDEINTMIARDPAWSSLKDRLYVTLKDNQARLQTSLPLGALQQVVFTDRYLNADGTFTMTFDAEEKDIHLLVHSLQVGDRNLPSSFNETFNQSFDRSFNQKIKENADVNNFLSRSKQCAIENGELVIETE